MKGQPKLSNLLTLEQELLLKNLVAIKKPDKKVTALQKDVSMTRDTALFLKGYVHDLPGITSKTLSKVTTLCGESSYYHWGGGGVRAKSLCED